MLKNMTGVEWSKIWLLPGLMDAATKVEVVSRVDLRTRRTNTQLKLGLWRRLSAPGLSLVRAVSLDGGAGHISLDLGATLQFPDEVVLRAGAVRSRFATAEVVRLEVDFDRLDIRVEY